MSEKRYSLIRWNKDALQAAGMSVGVCTESVGLVGIDMIARDGHTFAHGHFDIEGAEAFWRDLGAAIVEARARRIK